MTASLQPALFADLEPVEGEEAPPVGVLFSCPRGHVRRVNYRHGSPYPRVVTCHCGQRAIGAPIVGVKTGRRCDARCMFAKGPVCMCACGGSNHGAGFCRA